MKPFPFNKVFGWVLCCLIVVYSTGTLANGSCPATEVCSEADTSTELKKIYNKVDSRLMPYEPNSFIYRWAEDDEAALRAHISFQYRVHEYGVDDSIKFIRNSYFYLSYTGEFDFYVGTRESGPVVNRINNPAVHWRKVYDDFKLIDVSLEHKSNGQSTEVETPRQIERVQLAYLENDRHFFDTISRGSDFLAIEGKYKAIDCSWSFDAKAKVYLRTDYAITWDDNAGKDLSIEDYDRVRFLASYKIAGGELGVEWTIGDKHLKTDSWNIDYLFSEDAVIPIYVRYHYGPLFTLSNYTKEENYIGIGVKLIP